MELPLEAREARSFPEETEDVMFAIVLEFPCGEKVPTETTYTRAEAKRMKAHYEHPRNASQYGVTKAHIVPAKEAA